MNQRDITVRAIFTHAVEIDDERQRSDYLAQACGADTQLRRHVEDLIQANATAGAFLGGAGDAAEPAVPNASAGTLLATPVTEKPGDKIGPYKLLQQIGEGGCGVVYMAEQEQPVRRKVALKVIKLGMDTKSVIARFEAERQALALMEHPNIARVLDAGATNTGRPYFVMELVRGLKITEHCDQYKLPTTERLNLFIQVCQAIQHAHQKGIIHRDIKPSNILVTLHDGVPVPKVIDFGIAKATQGKLTDQTLFTAFEQLIGTPAYMSPEQAEMSGLDIDTRSDVYALGVLLYELLTGQTPFDTKELMAAGLDAMRRTIREHEPPRPSTRLSTMLEGELTTTAKQRHIEPLRLIRLMRGDLDWIVMKCLEKDRARRYETAIGLATDLQSHLNCEPVVARPPSRLYEFQKTVRRHKFGFAAAGAVTVALMFGVVASTWQAVRARRAEKVATLERNRAEQQAQVAAQETTRATRQLYTSDMNRVYQAWEEGNLQLAQELLEAHMPQSGKEDLRGFEWRYLSRLCRDESRVNFTNVNFVNTRDEWAGHHGLALAADDGMVIAASDNTLKWLDCRKQREAQSTTVGAEAITELSMAMDQPGLVGYRTDRVNVLSPTGATLLGTGLAPGLGGEPGSPGAFALSWDGALLCISCRDQSLLILDVKTGNQIGPSFDLGDDVSSLAFSSDGRYVACGTSGTKIHILEAPRFKRVNVLTKCTAFVTRLVFDRSGKQLAAGCNDSHIRIWSFPECALVADLTGHHGMIGDLAFSPDGRRLASGGTDHTVRLWTLPNLTGPTLFHGHRGAVKSVLFSRDGNLLFTGSEDRTVKVWDASPQQSTNILSHLGYTADVTFSADGTLLAVADYTSQTAVLWRVADQSCIGNVGHHASRCTEVRFSPDGKLLATVGGDTNVQIWSLPLVKKILDFSSGGDESSIAFHPKRPILAVGCNDIRFCDLQKRAPVKVLENAPTDGVRKVTFSPDGNWIVLGMDNGQVAIWDFGTGRLSYSFQEHSGAISALCFSHNGRLLASGGIDHLAVIYDLGRRRVMARLDGHQLAVHALAFAPDNKTLVSTSWDGTIRFWSVANYQVVLTLAHDGGPVTAVAFSPKGNLMATSCSDRTVRLWPAEKWDVTAASKQAEGNRK